MYLLRDLTLGLCAEKFAKQTPKDYAINSSVVHERNLGRMKFHNCPLCSFHTKYANSLRTHLKRHTGERPFLCTVCQKTFRLKHHLESHSRLHNSKDPFTCAKCGTRFEDTYTLRQHQLQKTC